MVIVRSKNMNSFTMFSVLFLVPSLLANSLGGKPTPEVKIDQGILSGITSDDGSFFQYLGIPYATTNSSTRFKVALPGPSWEGVFKAVEAKSKCPQFEVSGELVGKEDCLKMNIYVPSKANVPLPVMVYIHGGAFYVGDGGQMLYGGDFIVKQNVILVTFNYRLGVLGFTCLHIKEAPGNAGLKDQIAALRWVKKNIAAFGGDRENVTLFGESAGGASTSLLIASPATEGLFNRAIEQSGSALSNWAINSDPLRDASLIAKELGHDTKNPQEIYDLFIKTPYEELVAAQPKKPLSKYFDKNVLNLPCIEKHYDGEEAVIDDLPFNLINRRPKNIPLMFGSNSKEGLFLIAKDNETTVKIRDERYTFASDLGFPSEDEAEAVDKKIRKVYFDNERMTMKNIMKQSDLLTDLQFAIPAILESEIMAKTSQQPVYNYYFNYSGDRNVAKYLSRYKNESGASHGDELFYLFRGDIWPHPINHEDRKMIYYMTKMWTDFAKYGDPTPATSDIPVKWTPTTQDNMNFLYIDSELKMGPIPNLVTYRLWKDIYEKYRKSDFGKL